MYLQRHIHNRSIVFEDILESVHVISIQLYHTIHICIHTHIYTQARKHQHTAAPHLRIGEVRVPKVNHQNDSRLRERGVSRLVDEGIVEYDALSFFQVNLFPSDDEICCGIIL